MTDFEPVKVLDARLNCRSDISYGVFEGGQNVTLQRFPSQSATVNQMVFNITTPNQNSIIDRRAYWRATVQFTITGNTPAAAGYYPSIVNYGVNDSLAPFPLHSVCQTMQNTINSNTLSLNVADILPALLRFYDPKDLEKYSSYTPTMLDNFGVYDQVTSGFNANPLAGIGNENYDMLKPRGSFNLDYLSWASPANITSANAFQSYNPSAYPSGYPQSTAVTLYGQVTLCEPLLLSPWLLGNNHLNAQGYFGVENLSFTMNLVSSGNRFWRTDNTNASPAGITCTIKNYLNCSIDLIFLTPKPSLLLSSKNTVPLLIYERYITQSGQALASSTGQPSLANPQIVLNSNNLIFNQIPDKVLIYARPAINIQTSEYPDYYFPIQAVNIQFNNVSGVLSSYTPQALWALSRDNGCQLGWEAWSGFGAYGQNTQGNNSVSYVPTVGSILCCAFGKDINIGESFLAPGSIGNFNFQVNLTIANNQLQAFAAGNIELVVIAVNSGIASFDRGVTSTYTALLSKENVLKTTTESNSSRDVIDSAEMQRMIGTGFFDDLKSGMTKAFKTLRPVARAALSASDDPRAKMAANVLGAMGSGRPALMNRLA